MVRGSVTTDTRNVPELLGGGAGGSVAHPVPPHRLAGGVRRVSGLRECRVPGVTAPGSRGITKHVAVDAPVAMRLKLLATTVLVGAALIAGLFVERRTRPDLADEYGD